MFSCNPEYKGLISVIWPDATIYEDDLPFFLPDTRIIFYSDKPLNRDDDNIIHVTKEVKRIELSSKEGFIRALKHILGRLDSWEEEALLKLKGRNFWVKAKNRLLASYHKKDFKDDFDSSILTLFDALFKGYSYSYPVYVSMNKPYKTIVLSLMTLMINSVNNVDTERRDWYSGLLNRNSKYIKRFRKHILRYVDSKQTEQDFLTFLYEVSPYSY